MSWRTQPLFPCPLQGSAPLRASRALGACPWQPSLCCLALVAAQGAAPGGAPAPQPTITILVWHWPFASHPPELPGDTCARYRVARCPPDRQPQPAGRAPTPWSSTTESCRPSRPACPGWAASGASPGCGPPWSRPATPAASAASEVFNWVLSYRRGSDIFVPYGRLGPVRAYLLCPA